jgi:hypothetical protein
MTEELIEALKTDFYIKLASEADMPTALAAFYRQDSSTVVDPDTGEEHVQLEGEPYLVKHSPDHAIDIVGVIYEPTGDMLTDGEGNQYPETAPIDGWHINIRLSGDARRADVEAIDALYGVTPNSPSRVWL